MFRNKKFKYGTSAVVFTALAVAAIIVINAIFSSLSAAYLWYIDMTGNQVYGFTEATRNLLDKYENGGEKDTSYKLNIIFLEEPDALNSYEYTRYIYNCALEYANEYDFINIKHLDPVKEPTTVAKFQLTSTSKLTADNIIFENETTNNSVIHSLIDFYVTNSSTGAVSAFNGEYRITSSLLQLLEIAPIAYFTTGHGETLTNSYGENIALYRLFEDAGFEVRTIDLSKEEIDPDAQVIIINSPKYDFLGAYDDVNEIKKIDNFLDGNGSLMVFIPPNAQTFPELDEFLAEWGIQFEDTYVADKAHAVSTDGLAVISEYPAEGFGASIHTELRELESTPKAIVKYASPITMLWENKGARNISTVLTSSRSAQSYSLEDASAVDYGPFNLMVLSAEMNIIDNEEQYSYVLAAGTEMFADDAYVASSAYGNRDILFVAMKAMGKENVPTDINYKALDDEALTIEVATAQSITVVLVAVIPALVAIMGIVVFIRRKRL